MLKVSVVGASGYVGGELLRLIFSHPETDLHQATSQRYADRFLHTVHPNLRGVTKHKFSAMESLEECDLLFLCLPHGEAAGRIDEFAKLAPKLIDCSADFRIKDPVIYEKWYGKPHANVQMLSQFVYGLPELYREQLGDASFVSGVGCNATATNLALLPLAKANLIQKVVVEVKVGSSEGGNSASLATHHPERVNVVRSFAPTGHRHQAEITQALGDFELHFSATAVELVRGVIMYCPCFLQQRAFRKRSVEVVSSRLCRGAFC